MRYLLLLFLAAPLHAIADEPQSLPKSMQVQLPSDEEMIKRGRKVIGDANEDMGSAQRQVDVKAQYGAIPLPGSGRRVTKEMVQEALHPELAVHADARKHGKTDLIIFVSFSMPDDLLIKYSQQAKDAGATLVLRGLYEHSLRKTQAKAAPLNPAVAGWEINPVLFRKFHVNKVPSIVLADAEAAEVVENGCAQPGAYLKVDGDVSVHEALSIMKWQGDGKLAGIAEERLKKLEGM